VDRGCHGRSHRRTGNGESLINRLLLFKSAGLNKCPGAPVYTCTETLCRIITLILSFRAVLSNGKICQKCQNLGGAICTAIPPLQILGGRVPPSPRGLRLWRAGTTYSCVARRRQDERLACWRLQVASEWYVLGEVQRRRATDENILQGMLAHLWIQIQSLFSNSLLCLR